jgi:dihydroorotate dehydrogenase (subfamily 1) family protein
MAVKKDLSIEFAGVKCLNPFFLSSSPVGNNYDMISKCFEEGWGGVFYKTIDLWPENEISPIFGTPGNAGEPWTAFKNCEHASQNSLEENLEHMVRLKRDYPDHKIFASFMGQTEEDWKLLTSYADQAGVDGVEINLSCPHMGRENMGSDAGTNPNLVAAFTKAAVSGTKLPIIAKMTPNQTTMLPAAIAAMKAGATGLSAINTVKSLIDLDYDLFTSQPAMNGKSAISGLSGSAVKPIAMRFTQEMASCPDLKGAPISSIGGIYTWNDAVDFLLLGARNVQVTTSIMEYGYRIVADMASGMMHFMDEKGFNSLDDFIGLAVKNIVSPSEFDREYLIRPNFDHEKCVGCGRCYVSCYDGGHQAIKWNEENRRPELDTDHCVGCHLCQKVCPVKDCILPGELVWRDGFKPRDIKLRTHFE